jgi:hypothetical protein
MHRSLVRTGLAVSLLALAVLPAGARGPSTPAERDEATRLARLLETTPWSEEAAGARQGLGTFLAEVPDITVKRCLSLFGSAEQRRGIPAALLDQQMFSAVAHQLTHPEDGAGSTATFLASLEGVLAAYSAWRAHGGLEAVPRLDELAQLQKDGRLEAHVRGQGRNCL